MLEAELIEDVPSLEELRSEWHELAVASASPMSLPAWMLGWLRHMAPADVKPRVVVVRERGRLLALAPMYVETDQPGRLDCRLLSAPDVPGVSLLAVPGREWETAEAIAPCLATASPRADMIALEGAPVASHWPQALAKSWPGRIAPRPVQYLVQNSPVVSLDGGSFETWLKGKNSSYRAEIRRRRRRFEEAGGSTRVTTHETLREDIASFLRLHKGRWEGRGKSSIVAVEDQLGRMLIDVAGELLDDGQLRMTVLEIAGEPVAAQLATAAGGEVLFLNGGWDERFSKLSPSVLCKLAMLEDAFARGDRRVNLGPGDQSYKVRLAEGNDPVAWTILMLPGPRLPLTYARTAPMLVRQRAFQFAKRALAQEQADRLRGWRSRLQAG
jgi:CelD/BcsL family acetyltransferase involved in cellulose biosynthesis